MLHTVLSDIFSVNPRLYSCHYFCFVVLNTVVPAALQIVNKFVSKLYKRSTTIPAMSAKITQSILALWECIGEAHTQANKNWKILAWYMVNADGKYDQGWKWLKWKLACKHNHIVFTSYFTQIFPVLPLVSGQFRRWSTVCPDCLSTHLPRSAVLPQSHSGLSDIRGLWSDWVHCRLHFLYARRLECR